MKKKGKDIMHRTTGINRIQGTTQRRPSMVPAPAGHHCAHKPKPDLSNREKTVPPAAPNTTWFTSTLKACAVFIVHCRLKTTRWKQRITKWDIMAHAVAITQNIKNIHRHTRTENSLHLV